MILIPPAFAGIAIGIRKDIMAFAPDEEPIERRQRALWRSICFWTVMACLVLVTGALLVLSAVYLAALTFFPTNFSDPIDTLINAGASLVASGAFACIAFSVLRDEWKRRRQRPEQVEIVGGMTRYTGGERQS